MCGIAGIFSLTNSEQPRLRHVVAMTEAMRHRGPDDEGYVAIGASASIEHYLGNETAVGVRARFPEARHVGTAFDQPAILAMGHRRLSILDVSPAGHQPMSYAEGRYWLIFNGEIYNFRKIRGILENLGHRFHSDSDSEVILAAYAEWRESCVAQFNGDFAFALWDNQERSLFCARDRIGIKPFYYILDNGQFIFGSDIKTLLASGLYRPEPDPQGLYLAMAFGMAPRPITAFKGVRALEQAHWMRLHADGRIERQRYWQIPVGTQDGNMTESDAVDLLDEQLTRAVRRRLVADVPVGTFMSGGIDSTTISAISAQLHPGIKAFTLGYQGDAPERDEVQEARATARMHPMQHIVSRADPEQSLSDLALRINCYEEPFYNIGANHVLSRIVRQNKVTVILNGLGGDELFAGYGYYRFRNFPRIPLMGALPRLPRSIFGGKIARAWDLISARTADQRHTLLFRKSSDAELRRLMVPALHPHDSTPELLHALYAKGMDFTDGLEALGYMDMMNYIGNHHVHRVDQFTMAFSIEGRFPFLDHKLIEAAYRIPSRLKIRNGEQKFVLRRVAARYIAPVSLSMKKKGFGLPLEQWMKGPLKPIVDKSLARLEERPEVQSATVRNWYEQYAAGRLSPMRIWHLVALELWFEHFIDESSMTHQGPSLNLPSPTRSAVSRG
jgi:asparagine synthase (glutamine-hydrolysing)